MRSVGHVIKSCESQRAFQYIISSFISMKYVFNFLKQNHFNMYRRIFFQENIFTYNRKKNCQDIFTVTLGNSSVYLPKQYCYQINMSLFIKCDLVKHIYAETEVGI